MKYIGSHVSAKKNLATAVSEATDLNLETFAFFLSSPRTWKPRGILDSEILGFKKACSEAGFKLDKIVPHGNYLINLATTKPDILLKSKELFFREVEQCCRLGLSLYVFHPGSPTGDVSKKGSEGDSKRVESLHRVAEAINACLEITQGVTILIENMAGQGQVLGKSFAEIKTIIDHVSDQSRVGVCLDTCHAFASGWDLRTPKGIDDMFTEFDRVIGMSYLKAIHLNDSKEGLGSRKDRHEDIGSGEIGKGTEAFAHLLGLSELDDMPIILETPNVTDSLVRELKSLDKSR